MVLSRYDEHVPNANYHDIATNYNCDDGRYCARRLGRVRCNPNNIKHIAAEKGGFTVLWHILMTIAGIVSGC